MTVSFLGMFRRGGMIPLVVMSPRSKPSATPSPESVSPPRRGREVGNYKNSRLAQGYRHAGGRDRPEVEWPRRRQWNGAARKMAGLC